ncbi:MAG: 16S rRNA (cytosine(967)-C(5))-methyltransferase RsmB, partial [Nitrospirales bacterium]|nr:16S rRNA (cytosine(967)-C(5))-methyltransferase RsmB [Nitrospirales bacterium]
MSTRSLALRALKEIEERSLRPKEALDAVSGDIDKRERAFLMELVYGVLRQREGLDWILKQYIKKISGISSDTRQNLRMAVYQLLHMRVPEHAVVHESVELEKRKPHGKPSLVNAVLRNIIRQKGQPAPPLPDDPLERLTITTSHPRWLLDR